MPKRKQIRMVLQKITGSELENKLTQKLLDILCIHLRDKLSERTKYGIKWRLYARIRSQA